MKIILIIVAAFAALTVTGAVILVSIAPEGLMDVFGGPDTGTSIRVEAAVRRSLFETVSAPGEIEPLIKVDISAEVSSRIEQLPFREGQEVGRGDIVVKLDDRNLRAATEVAKAQREGEQFRLQSEQATLAGLLKNLAFARKTLQRQRDLYETGDISSSSLDQAQERVDNFEANIAASTHALSIIESSLAGAEANIDRAEDALTKTVIRAPMDGIITVLNAEVGEVVLLGTMNNPGTVIMTIADLSRMILNARVAETDVAKVGEAQNATIHINAYPDEVFTGMVRTIALQRTTEMDGTGYFETEIEVELQGRRIYSGLVANVDIEIAEHDGIVVESQAVVERLVDDLPSTLRNHRLINNRKKIVSVVYVVTDGKALCTPVKPGASDLTHTVILDGLDEGVEVVVGPFKVLENIKHDQAVKDETEESATDSESQETDAAAAEPEAESSQ